MRRWPILVVLSLLAACGAQPADELAGRWQVQQIAGASLGEDVDIWLSIDAGSESVIGSTGCNDFTATLARFDTNVAFSPPQEQAGDCASIAAATDEERFLAVLPAVRRYVRHGRSLELLPATPGAESLIRLRLTDGGDG